MIACHLELAHRYWRSFLQPADFVIDATCGNGYDSLVLAKMSKGNLLCIDVQKSAISTTKDRLKKHLPYTHFKKISYLLGCHSFFPPVPDKPRLIVYNLGYLPGGNKKITTTAKTTLKSLEASLTLLKPDGALSIICYSGHTEGEKEKGSILDFSKSLSKSHFRVCHHEWINKLKAPSLLLIQKIRN